MLSLSELFGGRRLVIQGSAVKLEAKKFRVHRERAPFEFIEKALSITCILLSLNFVPPISMYCIKIKIKIK